MSQKQQLLWRKKWPVLFTFYLCLINKHVYLCFLSSRKIWPGHRDKARVVERPARREKASEEPSTDRHPPSATMESPRQEESHSLIQLIRMQLHEVQNKLWTSGFSFLLPDLQNMFCAVFLLHMKNYQTGETHILKPSNSIHGGRRKMMETHILKQMGSKRAQTEANMNQQKRPWAENTFFKNIQRMNR